MRNDIFKRNCSLFFGSSFQSFSQSVYFQPRRFFRNFVNKKVLPCVGWLFQTLITMVSVLRLLALGHCPKWLGHVLILYGPLATHLSHCARYLSVHDFTRIFNLIACEYILFSSSNKCISFAGQRVLLSLKMFATIFVLRTSRCDSSHTADADPSHTAHTLFVIFF